VCLVAPLQIQNNLPTYILLGLAVAVVLLTIAQTFHEEPRSTWRRPGDTIHPINYLLSTVFYVFVSLPPPSRWLVCRHVILSVVGQVAVGFAFFVRWVQQRWWEFVCFFGVYFVFFRNGDVASSCVIFGCCFIAYNLIRDALMCRMDI